MSENNRGCPVDTVEGKSLPDAHLYFLSAPASAIIICLTTQSSAFMVSDKTVIVSALGSGEQ